MTGAEIIEKWKALVPTDYKKYLRFFTKELTTSQGNEVPDLHKEAFQKIDCLKCANCCRSTPALLSQNDIKRISARLDISKKEFFRKYVLEDINGEWSLNRVPCHFLEQDNTCRIYDVRPDACRGFPHTDDADYLKRPVMNAKNVMVCPAAFYVAEKLKPLQDSLLNKV